MKVFFKLKKILKSEPEEWLAYLYGQRLSDLPHLKDYRPRLRGVFFRCLIFFYYMACAFFRSFNVRNEKKIKVDFYFYAGTANQANSLVGTVKSLSGKKRVLLVDANNKSSLNGANDVFEFNQLDVKIGDVVVAFFLFLSNGPKLYSRLKSNDELLVRNYFNVFCQAYLYLPVFFRLLNKYKPEYVIVSNDHNVDCRCLLSIAHNLNIKTVYMQHASVSSIFPALVVDYAFLDGESALNTYLNCKDNFFYGCVSRPPTKVFLSGQKKVLNQLALGGERNIGLAINRLDKFVKVVGLVNKLTAEGFVVSLRWHPGQEKSDVQRIKDTFEDNRMVLLSDPQQESVDDYLSEICYLICGNSSINLEAAIVGVIPIYYQVQPPHIDDYYGYVKNGIAIKADSYQHLVTLLRQKNIPKPNPAAVKYYSGTYNTEWYGKEGELVARTLLDLQAGQPWTSLFGARTYANDEKMGFNIISTDIMTE